MRLAARELGVAVHEQSMLYDLPETRAAMSEILRIPEHCRIVGAMCLGYREDHAPQWLFSLAASNYSY